MNSPALIAALRLNSVGPLTEGNVTRWMSAAAAMRPYVVGQESPTEAALRIVVSEWTPAPTGYPPVLDMCCGPRMMWFDKTDRRAVFIDKRKETHELPDISSSGGVRSLVIDPDIVGDFTSLPFPDDSFSLVVFDPPHFGRNGATGWVGLKYGTLDGDWRETLRLGFAEGFRVLKPNGTLIFKWNDTENPVSEILRLTPVPPLFGHKSGKQQHTHWIAFLKPESGVSC